MLSVFDEVAPSIAVVLLFVALLAFVVTGLPVLIDLFALIVFGVGGALARLVFRRPWTVEATSEDRRVERKVVGWRASGDEVRALARDIQHGQVR